MGIGEVAREIGRCRKGDVVEKSECQRLLTVENRACGGAPERLEGRVRLESLREVFCALRTDAVAPETASEGAIGVSAAIGSGESDVQMS